MNYETSKPEQAKPEQAKPEQPFRLLLYLEWLLLGIALVHVVFPAPVQNTSPVSIVTILCVASFGLMGLRLPTQRLVSKWLYIALEFALILLPVLFDHQNHSAPFLGIVVLIRSCQMFKLPGRLLVAGFMYAAFALPLFWQELPPPFKPPKPEEMGISIEEIPTDSQIFLLKLNVILSVGLILVFVLLLVNSLLTERQSRQKLTIAHEKLRHYALRIEDQATLQERNRIAREIHDALGHALTAQSIQLENALLFCPEGADKTRTYLIQAQQLGTKALHEVRQSVSTLRSNPLRGQTLKTILAYVVNEFQAISGIVPECHVELLETIPAEVSTALYRIVQEALINICKHSAATRVSIDLEEKMGAIVLRIADDGRGFNPEQNSTGFGIQGMRERTAALGGQFSLVSEPGKGCLVEVIVPILLRELTDYDSGVTGRRSNHYSSGIEKLAGR